MCYSVCVTHDSFICFPLTFCSKLFSPANLQWRSPLTLNQSDYHSWFIKGVLSPVLINNFLILKNWSIILTPTTANSTMKVRIALALLLHLWRKGRRRRREDKVITLQPIWPPTHATDKVSFTSTPPSDLLVHQEGKWFDSSYLTVWFNLRHWIDNFQHYRKIRFKLRKFSFPQRFPTSSRFKGDVPRCWFQIISKPRRSTNVYHSVASSDSGLLLGYVQGAQDGCSTW